jgi:2-iminobutanoate/2-iminopropanoate deaminase
MFVSGQLPSTQPLTLDTADIVQETRQVMENIQAVLQEANMNFTHVVKTTIFLTDMNYFGRVNEVYASYITKVPPARETVEVRKLPEGHILKSLLLPYGISFIYYRYVASTMNCFA